VGVIHHAVIRGSGNQALVLFIGALSRVSAEAAIYSGLDDVEWRDTFDALIFAIREMAQAVLDRRATDAQIAHDLLVGHLGKLFEASLVRQRKPITSVAPARAYSFFPPARPMKKVDRVEREIRETIIAAGWPVGGNLGSEKELAARFKAGRWVLREALRSLEQLGVVEMGRGGRSGLQIVSPDPEMVAQACRRQLKREGLRASDAAVVRSLLDDIARDAAHPMPICELFERALIE
jgi:DNA-binding FadR family transcriptional regulator